MSGDFNAKQKKKQKIAVIGLSSLMMVAMVVAVTLGIKGTGHGIIVDDDDGLATSTKAIKSVCHIVEYRHACERTLAHLHTSDPKKLATTTFDAALKNLQGALANSSSITAPKEDRRTSGAIETCKQVMEYAVGDLKRSIDHMSHFDMHKKDEYIENMRIWLSGAITLQETCIDAFENTTGDAGEKMKKLLVSSRELTSNSLDIVAELPSIVKSLSSFDSHHHERKLSQKQEKEKDQTEDELPIWMDFKQRRLLRDPGSKVKADIVVSKDGSSKFKTIMEALKEAPVRDPSKEFAGVNKMFVIYIKEGIYEEQVQVDETKSHIMFIGDGPTKTKITGNNSFADGFVLYKTATVSILGRNFIAKDIGFENSAGPEKHQAVSLLVQSDMSIFYNCRIDGYQDTLYAHSYRQFYRHSTISGSINLILGNAAAVFQNCKFVIRKPLDNQECVITSQGRLHMKEPTGFILQNSTITADPLYYPLRHNKAYLGQPWKKFSRTIVMQSYISDSIDSQGWKPWMGTFGESTCFLSEYENRGPGAKLEGRVKWQGIKNIDPREINGFTPRKFYGGDRWIAPTQVPYLAGLMPT